MKSKDLFSSAIVTVLILIGNLCFAQTGKTPLNEAEKAIAQSNSVYFSSFVKNDANIYANCYADDCIIMAPNSKSFYGRKGALDFFKLGYTAGLRNGKFITDAIYGDGDNYVTEMGRWQSIDANGKITNDGKFLVLWKKTASGWKMFRDSFSSNHPATK